MNRIVPLIFLSCAAYASTITLTSSALTTPNLSGSPTLNISPHPAWAAPLAGTNWISIASTGNPSAPNFVELPNGTVVSFYQQFFLDGFADTASLTVLADDTTSVVVNGHMIAAPFTTAGISCAAQPIGCLTSTKGVYGNAQLVPFLQAGNNRIQFDVLQHDSAAFGLDFAATISTNPEPGTLGLVGGVGLLIFLVEMKRRHRAGSPSV